MVVEFRLLGDVETRIDGRVIDVGHTRQRCVLVTLLIEANRAVSVDQLVDRVWADRVPQRARNAVSGYVSRLRQLLADAAEVQIMRQSAGYVLAVDPMTVDLHRFHHLIARAHSADADNAAALLEQALGLWRGEAFATLDTPWLNTVRETLEAHRLAAMLDRYDVALSRGQHAGVLADLSTTAAAHPLDERLTGQVILALYRCGRQAEALQRFEQVRVRLADELGVDPGLPLRRLHQQILTADPALAAPPTVTPPPLPTPPLPLPGAAAGPAPAEPREGATDPDAGPRDEPHGGTRTGPEAALVGRQSEMSTVRSKLAAITDVAAVLAIAGDPGIGKSRLLAELAGEAARAGRTVLAGRAAEFERDAPFGIFRNALEDHLKGLDSTRFATMAADEVRLLPNVFASVAFPGGAADAHLLAAERYRLHRAVRSLLEAVAGPAGLVLILDDLHWCDDGSAELLGHLLRHPPRARVLLALAYRPRQLSAQLHQVILGAVQRQVATVVDVRPLGFAESTTLLPANLSLARLRELYNASGGNPFYLEVLGRGSGHGEADDDAGAEAVPLSVRSALAGEFAALPAPHQRVAHAAAVAGDVFDPRLVAAVADAPVAAVLDAVDELSRRDLIRPSPVAGGFQFRHPLVRSAAYQHAQPGWRIAAHARAAEELTQRGSPPAERAGHIELAAAPGDLAAVEVLRTAALEALHATPGAAAHWLRSALRLLPQQPATTRMRLELLNIRAQALGITGHLVESRELLHEVLRMIPVGTDDRAALVTFMTMLEHLLGNHPAAIALLDAELSALRDQRGRAAGALLVAGVLGGLMQGQVEPKAIDVAIDVARGTGDRALLAAALGVSVVASHSVDVPSEKTTHWLDETVRLVDAMSDTDLAQRLDAGLFLGWSEAYLERFADAGQHLQRTLDIARRTGQSHLIGAMQLLASVVCYMRGDLRQALVGLDDALESAVLTGGKEAYGRILAYKSWVSVWSGDLADAQSLAEEAVGLTAGATDWQSGRAEAMLAFALHAAGDSEECLSILLKAGQGPELPTVRQVWKPQWYELLSAAASATGHLGDADGYATLAERLPAISNRPRRSGLIRLARVHPLLRTDPAAAARSAADAVDLFTRAGDRLSAAQAHLYVGLAHRDTGLTAEAEREFTRARRAFAACGARPEWLARATGIPLSAP